MRMSEAIMNTPSAQLSADYDQFIPVNTKWNWDIFQLSLAWNPAPPYLLTCKIMSYNKMSVGVSHYILGKLTVQHYVIEYQLNILDKYSINYIIETQSMFSSGYYLIFITLCSIHTWRIWSAETEVSQLKPLSQCGLQRLKHLLSCPLHKKFAGDQIILSLMSRISSDWFLTIWHKLNIFDSFFALYYNKFMFTLCIICPRPIISHFSKEWSWLLLVEKCIYKPQSRCYRVSLLLN